MTDHVFPESGVASVDILAEIAAMRPGDVDWRSGKAFSLVYDVDDAEHEALLEKVAVEFIHENALNPFRYETLLRMETEVISMATALVGAGCGSMSSGGTESIFLAVMTAREWARARGIAEPKVVTTNTAHPAFAKACKYLDVELVSLPHGEDGRAVPQRYEEAIDERTALLVVSSPCYPFGVIDPVEEVAAIAHERDLLCHVDACLGGWILPWWERLGEPVPPWDFRVQGVTSMSADIHKYGYTFKGASVVLYRDRELLQHQIFMFDAWPGGLYASSTAAGTRSGAPIAGAWTAIRHLGADGYMRLTARVLDATRRFIAGINAIDGLHTVYEPQMSVIAFGSDVYDMDAICDVMDDRGWNLDRQNGGLHLMVSPGHDRIADAFIADLALAVETHGEARGGEHVYGGVVPS